jgi:hypothetical protein
MKETISNHKPINRASKRRRSKNLKMQAPIWPSRAKQRSKAPFLSAVDVFSRSQEFSPTPKNKIKYGENTNHQKLCGDVNARQANSRLATKATTSTARRDVFACLSLPGVHTDRADQTSVVRRATRGLGTTPSQEAQSRKHVWCAHFPPNLVGREGSGVGQPWNNVYVRST